VKNTQQDDIITKSMTLGNLFSAYLVMLLTYSVILSKSRVHRESLDIRPMEDNYRTIVDLLNNLGITVNLPKPSHIADTLGFLNSMGHVTLAKEIYGRLNVLHSANAGHAFFISNLASTYELMYSQDMDGQGSGSFNAMGKDIKRAAEEMGIPQALTDRFLRSPKDEAANSEFFEAVKAACSREPTLTKILFLSSDPTNASRLRLGEELREIQEKLQLAKLRECFDLHQRMSVRPTDISQAMLDVQPNIVHFSGHGTTAGALCFENQIGEIHPIQPEALAGLFEQFATQVRCVLLNACYAEKQANAIAQHIDYVIGMKEAIGDKAAIAFAIGFYQALGAGRTIEEAYKLGCVQIRLQGIPEYLTPVFIEKGQAQS